MFLPYTLRLWEQSGRGAERVGREPGTEPHPSPRAAQRGPGTGCAPRSCCPALGISRGGFACINSALLWPFFFLFFKLLLLASGSRAGFNAAGWSPALAGARVGCGGPASYWAIGLATARKGPTPAFYSRATFQGWVPNAPLLCQENKQGHF